MESTALPLKIQCSESTQALLEVIGGYDTVPRGKIAVKVKRWPGSSLIWHLLCVQVVTVTKTIVTVIILTLCLLQPHVCRVRA